MTRRDDAIPLVRQCIVEAQTKLSQAASQLRDNNYEDSADDVTRLRKQCEVWTGPSGWLRYLGDPEGDWPLSDEEAEATDDAA